MKTKLLIITLLCVSAAYAQAQLALGTPASGVGTNLTGIPLTTGVTGVLPLANGGSNCATPYVTNPQTSTYQVLLADFTCFKTITVASGTFTITLVASAGQPPAGTWIKIINYGNGTVTIARSGQNINGGTASFILGASRAITASGTTIFSDGTNYFMEGPIPQIYVNSGAVDMSLAMGTTGTVYLNSTQTFTGSTTGESLGNFSWSAAAYKRIGTTYTLSTNTCSGTTLVGGATAGTFVSGTTGSCAGVVTMGNSVTAANGFHCTFNDRTSALSVGETASSTTTATFAITTVSGEVVSFVCDPF